MDGERGFSRKLRHKHKQWNAERSRAPGARHLPMPRLTISEAFHQGILLFFAPFPSHGTVWCFFLCLF